MKVLFLDAYFEPEQIAFTHLEQDLLEKLVEEGNEVQIICPTPTRGISKETAEEYKHKKKQAFYNGHVNVVRFSAPQEGRNPIIRAFRYLWCNLRTYQLGKNQKEVDVVFCNSTPPTQGWIAGKVARKMKVPLVYSLQDVFPDSLITTGLSQEGSLLWTIGRKIEDRTYAGCEKIIVITETMKENLLKKGVENQKIEVVNNWIDMEKTIPVNREENKLFDEFGIDRSKYIVLYAGNFGEAQGAEIVLEAAEKLHNENNIFFVIFGGGTGYNNAVEKAGRLENVFIHPLMPQNRISEVYSLGDVALITCKKGVGKSGMPSKTWSIMACNTPIIAAFDTDSELANVVSESGAGICIEPENSTLLANRILEKYCYERKPVTGRDYVEKNVSKSACLERYNRIMNIARRKPEQNEYSFY